MVDTTTLLARGWEPPGCVAQELDIRCLLNQVQVTAELYNLPLARDWRETLEDVLLEDADSDLLYRRDMDGFEEDPELVARLGLAPMHFDLWFEPFNDSFHVTPFAR